MNMNQPLNRRQWMERSAAALAVASVGTYAAIAAAPQGISGDTDWPWWRGPRWNGHAVGKAPPLDFGPTKNVLWKTPIAGRGHATPCVVGKLVFLSTADEAKQTQSLIACDRASGEVVWQRQLHAGGLGEKHEKNSHASATPAGDGERVYAVFHRDEAVWVTALDPTGEVVWQKNAGRFDDRYGYGSSPAICDDRLIVAGDSPAAGWLAAFDLRTGDEKWRTERPAMTSYGAAVVATVGDRRQIMLQGNQVAGYDLQSGRELWRHAAPAKATACSLCFDREQVYASGGYPERRIYALRPDGEGPLAEEKLVWRFEQKSSAAYVPTPLLDGERLFVVSDGGLATCLDTRDGRVVWNERLGGDFSASLTLIGDILIACSEQGRVVLLRAKDDFETIAEQKFDEGFFASPVVCDGRLYLRTTGHLYCIGS
jgi:outer membrane protein assembly factor BamB